MNNEKLKKELHALIDNTEDEELLKMVKEDIIAYQSDSKKDPMAIGFDDLSDLSPEVRQELEELAAEDPMKDTVSFEEYQKHMQEWRSRLK